MPGTSKGARKAYQTIIDRYGEDSLREWQSKGGSRKVKKGFAKVDPQKLREISSKGGKGGKRGRSGVASQAGANK